MNYRAGGLLEMCETQWQQGCYGGKQVALGASGKYYANVASGKGFEFEQCLSACTTRRYRRGTRMAGDVARCYGYGRAFYVRAAFVGMVGRGGLSPRDCWGGRVFLV